jgi:uncharacterized glyoxalase superfamily protein PhnB
MSETGTKRSVFGSALAYKDPRAALDWLEKAFGFETTLLITDEQGNIAHSEMSFGNGYIMVAGEWAENIKAPSSVGGAITQRVSVHLQSGVDAHCERARAAGARIVMEPNDQPYGARVYVTVDLQGHLWDFSEPREFSAKEMANAGMKVQNIGEEPEPGSFFPEAYYRDAKGAIDWLEKAFGFEPTMIIESDDAIRGHLAFQGYQLAVGSEWSSEGQPARLSPSSVGGANTQTIHVQLADGIDAHAERARAAGAIILQEPEDQFYGDRTYRALDPEGHMWTFGQTVRIVTPEEWDAASGLKTQLSR